MSIREESIREEMIKGCQIIRNEQRLLDWEQKRTALKYRIKGAVPQLFHDGNSHVYGVRIVK